MTRSNWGILYVAMGANIVMSVVLSYNLGTIGAYISIGIACAFSGIVSLVFRDCSKTEETIRTEERIKTLDQFGILYGEDAKRFDDYINSKPNTDGPAYQRLKKTSCGGKQC